MEPRPSSPTPEKQPPLGELLLREGLEFATADMTPNENYTVSLEGARPSLRAQKELEARFDVNFDSDRGAKLTFGFDAKRGVLRLDDLVLPLAGQSSANATIKRQGDVSYFSFIDINQSTFVPQMNGFDDEQIDALMTDFSMDMALSYPHKPELYRLWIDTLASRTGAWRIRESVDAISARKGDVGERITLERDHVIDRSTGAKLDIRGIHHAIDIPYNDVDGTVHTTVETAESLSGYGAPSFTLSRRTIDRVNHPFIDKNPTETESGSEPIILTRDSFHTFDKMIKSATRAYKKPLSR